MTDVDSMDNLVRFRTTKWSHILLARDTNGSLQAFANLVNTYWYPVYAFARRSGMSHHDAQDLTQSFWTHLMANNALENVAPEFGRFRNFLIASFRNFLSNAHRARNTLRRGGNLLTFSMDADLETRYACEAVESETPESLYERSWVEALLERVLQRLKLDYLQADKLKIFKLLEPYLTHRGETPPRDQVAAELEISLAAVNMSIHRMRRRYALILQEEVAAVVHDPSEVEDEIKNLLAVLAKDVRSSSPPHNSMAP